MAAHAPSLTLRQWDADALEAMAPVATATPWAGLDSLADVLNGSHLWEFEHGRRRALVALTARQLAAGRVLEVTGMVSLGERLQLAEVGRQIEAVAATRYGDVDLVSMTTRWAHLARACEREGWQPAGVTMTKRLRAH